MAYEKTVVVRATIEYEVNVPHSWDKDLIELQRNEGSWCASNMVDELQALVDKGACLCGMVEFEYLRDVEEKQK